MPSRVSLLLLSLLVSSLFAQEDTTYIQAKKFPQPSAWILANSCSACHGTNGAELNTDIPPLAGMDKDTFVAIMQAYKSEKIVKSSVMTMVAKQVTDNEIKSMADFFSKQKAVEWTEKNWRKDVVIPKWAREEEQ